VYWSYSNRSALIRVPLGWRGIDNLAMAVNPQQTEKLSHKESRQTAELRSPDGSANTHLLLAGMATSAMWAFRNPEESLKLAKECFVQGNIHDNPELCERLVDIATSCEETADVLLEQRNLYEKEGLFPASLIEKVAATLKEEKDAGYNRRIMEMEPEKGKMEARKLMHSNFTKY